MASRETTQSTEVVKSCLVLVISMSVFHNKPMIFKLMIRKVRGQAGRQAGRQGKRENQDLSAARGFGRRGGCVLGGGGRAWVGRWVGRVTRQGTEDF